MQSFQLKEATASAALSHQEKVTGDIETNMSVWDATNMSLFVIQKLTLIN
jgi:hypothetical protein